MRELRLRAAACDDGSQSRRKNDARPLHAKTPMQSSNSFLIEDRGKADKLCS